MEEQHPIEGLMVTAMNSIKQMIDVNTIIGDPIEALDNTVIIPISKVGFGFAAGGSEFSDETVNSYNKKEKEENIKYRLPFGGGSGAGVNITPVAFLIVQNDTVKLIEANHSSVLDKLVEYVPDVIEKINKLFPKKMVSEEEDDDDLSWDDDYNYDTNSDLEMDDTEFNDELEDEEEDNVKQNNKAEKETEINVRKNDESKNDNLKNSSKNNKNSKKSKLEKTIESMDLIDDDEE